MKCRLYDITSKNEIGFGKIIYFSNTVKEMYHYAYRLVRIKNNRKKELDLLISSGIGKSIMTISSIPELGIVIISRKNSTWVKEVI